jgi:hypothetical protein
MKGLVLFHSLVLWLAELQSEVIVTAMKGLVSFHSLTLWLAEL